MSSPGQTPAARIGRLEHTIPPPPCETCEGRRLAIVMPGDPEPESPCPACGRDIHIVVFCERQDGPQ